MKQSFILLAILFCLSCSETNIDPEAVLSKLPKIEREISFESDIRALNEQYCISCHSGTTPDAGLLLTNYNEFLISSRRGSDNRNSIFRIRNRTMPPSSSPALSNEEIQLFLKWEEDGFLEN